MNQLRVVGIMNGTSLDGIDFVYCVVKKSGKKISITLKDSASSEFSEGLRAKLAQAAKHQTYVADLAELHHNLGRYYASELNKHLKKRKWKIDLIGVHGQTVFHAPPVATLQIGESSYMAAEFKVPVVSDFRVADLACGGQGAPIATLFHQVVFSEKLKKQAIGVQNIGGISNLTYINSKGTVEKAFDTGPGNMLMDLLISKITDGEKKFDKNGEIAAQGNIHQGIVEKLIADSYFTKKPPKSCGREQFGDRYLQYFMALTAEMSIEDRMATLTELTAKTIALAYQEFCKPMPKNIILCGGGSKNTFLKSRIQFHLPRSVISTTEDFGWPAQTIEGAAFALLAAYRYWEIPSNIPKTTGASKAISLGKISIA